MYCPCVFISEGDLVCVLFTATVKGMEWCGLVDRLIELDQIAIGHRGETKEKTMNCRSRKACVQ